jgi:ligand-binding SRPBCC domain-containing protein
VRFVRESVIRASMERVFAFHERRDALERLTPPWPPAEIVKAAGSLRVGEQAILRLRFFGVVSLLWVAEHTAYDPPRSFEDTQRSGPFRRWVHRHVVEPHADGAVLRDEVDYELPFGALGRFVDRAFVGRQVARLFAHRHAVTRAGCEEPP